jgi:hypothetical protein
VVSVGLIEKGDEEKSCARVSFKLLCNTCLIAKYSMLFALV